MATEQELADRLERLRQVRASGTLRVETENERIEYRSDADLAAAIADLERQIAGARSSTPIVRTVVVLDKGYC